MQGLILMVGYTAVMIAVTRLFTKRQETAEGFLVADRHMGAVRSAMSIAATWIWAPALFTSAEKAYTNGTVGLFWFVVPNVLCLLFFIPYAKSIRQKMPDGITLSGFMGKTYGRKAQGIYLFQLTLLSVLSTGVQLLAGGKILATITGLPYAAMVILLAVSAYSYSQFSGIRASVMTDVVQMVVILASCALFVPWALHTNNDAAALMRGLSGASGEYGSLFDTKGAAVLFSFGLPTAIGLISGPFGDQCFWQRAFACEQKKIGRAFALGAVLFAVVPLSMGALGFIAAGSGFVASDTGVVNMELVAHLFPSWAICVFALMLVSGLLSTVDSNLCAAASLTHDVIPDAGVKTSKVSMVLLLCAGAMIAFVPGLTVTHLFMIYGILRATTLLPTVLTLKGKVLTDSGVFLGVLSGLVVGWPLFIYATNTGNSALKTVGCLMAAILPGVVSALASRKGGAGA